MTSLGGAGYAFVNKDTDGVPQEIIRLYDQAYPVKNAPGGAPAAPKPAAATPKPNPPATKPPQQ